MATLKHINSKNADYGAAEQYLLFEHDEFTMKPVLDETGRLIPVSYTHLDVYERQMLGFLIQVVRDLVFLLRKKLYIYMVERLLHPVKTKQMCIRDSGNTYKHGNSYLLWEVDKDNIANQSAISLIIRATGICWNQVVCKGMARNKGISLKQKYRYFIGTICLYFRANIYYHISTKGESI